MPMHGIDAAVPDGDSAVQLTERQLWELAAGEPVTLDIGSGAGGPVRVDLVPPDPLADG